MDVNGSDTWWQGVGGGLQLLSRQVLGIAGLILVVTILFTALFGDFLAPEDPLALSIRDKFLPPSFAHPFGTDFLGRDVFSRVVSGSRIAMTAAVA